MTPTLHRRSGTHDAPAPRPPTPSPFLGRLEFPTCHGPRSVIVECVRAEDGYTLHLPAFNEASNYLTDAPVSLTAVERDTGDADACISGRSRLITDDEVSARTAEQLERWPEGPAARYFHITPGADPPARPVPSPPRGRRGRRPSEHRRGSSLATSTPAPEEQSRG